MLLLHSILAIAFFAPCAAVPPLVAVPDVDVCEATAKVAREASTHELLDDLLIAFGKCLNLTDRGEQKRCLEAAKEEYRSGLEKADEQYEARLALCELVGCDPYDPPIDPARFVSVIDHPLLPFAPGTVMVYEGETEDGTEIVTVEVTHHTRKILGVDCVVVRDTVELDGETIEDTFDCYAQDVEGNVWYFGEHSESYEEGVLVSLEGSWESGVDGAKPGIVMEAVPQVGDTYRQEFLLGEAEDAATVLSVDESVSLDFGDFEHCLQTRDFTPVEPDANEHKFYAPGIGFILEVDVVSGQRLELVDIFQK